MAPDPSTIILGRKDVPFCYADRILLEFFVYADSDSPVSSVPVDGLPKAVAAAVNQEVNKNWEMTASRNEANGLRAQCWEPKSRHKTPYSCCAPTLIFRGSRQVFTDLAIYFRIDFVGQQGTFIDGCYIMDKTGLDVPGNDTKAWALGGHALGMTVTGATKLRTSLQTKRWDQFPLFDETHTVQAPNVTDDSFMELTLRLQVEIWAGPNGDWANNFRQGWGVYSPLYQHAMTWAADQVKRLRKEYSPPRIFFAGHSLGGGVASAAAHYCRYKFVNDRQLSLNGVTFNAAGLHPNTIAPAKIGSTSINDYTVRDEILTTLQSRTADVPFLGAILRIAKRTLPVGVTAVTIPKIQSKSPGGWIVKPTPATKNQPANPGIPFPPEGALLPVLFPISKQTVIPVPKTNTGLFPNVAKVDEVMTKSQTVLELLQNLVQMIHDEKLDEVKALRKQYQQNQENTWDWLKSSRSRMDNLWFNSKFYGESSWNFFNAMKPEFGYIAKLMTYSVAYHLMPSVAENYYKKV